MMATTPGLEAAKARVRQQLSRAIRSLESLEDMDPKNTIDKASQVVNQEGHMEDIMEARFRTQSEHGPGSKKWKSLSPKYAQWKAKKGYSSARNVRTGDMRTAAAEAVSGTYEAGKIPQWGPHLMEDPEYAKYANEQRPFIDPPTRRELLKADKRAAEEIKKEITRRLA